MRRSDLCIATFRARFLERMEAPRLAHHGDDLFHRRRVGGIEPSLVAAGRPAWSPGMVASERRRPAASSTARRSWDLLPIAQRDTEPAALPALTHPRQRHHLQIALSLRHRDAEASHSSTAHPALVRCERLRCDRRLPLGGRRGAPAALAVVRARLRSGMRPHVSRRRCSPDCLCRRSRVGPTCSL